MYKHILHSLNTKCLIISIEWRGPSLLYTMYMLSYTALFPKGFDDEGNERFYDEYNEDADQTDADQTNPTARPPRSTTATTTSQPTGK